jgi:hypothetical protein
VARGFVSEGGRDSSGESDKNLNKVHGFTASHVPNSQFLKDSLRLCSIKKKC